MEQHRSKLFLALVSLGTLILTGVAILSSYRVSKPSPVPRSFAANPTPTPTEVSKESILSPDGKFTLTLASVKKANGQIGQTFSITNEKDKTTTKIFSKDSSQENRIFIPFNTFSPNDNFIFLEYPDSGTKKHLVLRTDGKEIAKGKQSVEVEERFYEKYPDFVITEVTGWGGYSLIVVNTNFKDGKTGPSWWFDLSNLGFIRLSTRFN